MSRLTRLSIPDNRSREVMLSPQIRILSALEGQWVTTKTTAAADRAIRLSYSLGSGLFLTPYGKALFKVGHDPWWRHYVVCFEGPRTCMLTMTNSSNGEDIQDALLRNVLADAFTPVEWQGFQPLRDMARYER
jgi:hypothetical protein